MLPVEKVIFSRITEIFTLFTVVLGRGRVGRVGRVGTIMRVAGARVCAVVVGAEASSSSDLAKPFFRAEKVRVAQLLTGPTSIAHRHPRVYPRIVPKPVPATF